MSRVPLDRARCSSIGLRHQRPAHSHPLRCLRALGWARRCLRQMHTKIRYADMQKTQCHPFDDTQREHGTRTVPRAVVLVDNRGGTHPQRLSLRQPAPRSGPVGNTDRRGPAAGPGSGFSSPLGQSMSRLRYRERNLEGVRLSSELSAARALCVHRQFLVDSSRAREAATRGESGISREAAISGSVNSAFRRADDWRSHRRATES
jgi:hypothetical protein